MRDNIHDIDVRLLDAKTVCEVRIITNKFMCHRGRNNTQVLQKKYVEGQTENRQSKHETNKTSVRKRSNTRLQMKFLFNLSHPQKSAVEETFRIFSMTIAFHKRRIITCR